jgi:O-antigen/teichoic acid export membrane protein
MRFSAIFIVGLATIFAALPGQSLGLIFPAEYRAAAEALRILSFGIAAFGLMVIANTILNGAGMPKKAMTVVILTLAVLIAAVVVAIRQCGPDNSVLVGAATGSTLGMVFGLIFSGIIVFKQFGAFLPVVSAVRILVSAAVGVAVGQLLPDAGKLFTLVACVVVLAAYFLALTITREFNKEDLDKFKRIVSRSK